MEPVLVFLTPGGIVCYFERNDDGVVCPLDFGGAGVEEEIDAFRFEGFLHFRGNFRIFARNDLANVLNHGDLAAKTGEHLAEFESDIASAENYEVPGK